MDAEWAVVIGAAIGFVGSTLSGAVAARSQRKGDRETRSEERDDARRQRWVASASEAYVAASSAVAHLGDPGLGVFTGIGKIDIRYLEDAQSKAKEAHQLLWRAAAVAPTAALAALIDETARRITFMAKAHAERYNLVHHMQSLEKSEAEARHAESQTALDRSGAEWREAVTGDSSGDGLKALSAEQLLVKLRDEIAEFVWPDRPEDASPTSSSRLGPTDLGPFSRPPRETRP